MIDTQPYIDLGSDCASLYSNEINGNPYPPKKRCGCGTYINHIRIRAGKKTCSRCGEKDTKLKGSKIPKVQNWKTKTCPSPWCGGVKISVHSEHCKPCSRFLSVRKYRHKKRFGVDMPKELWYKEKGVFGGAKCQE